MPVEFLTREQEAQYGKFNEDPTPEQLAKFFWLDDQDRMIIYQLRSESNRLGFAIQLGTVRFLSTFLIKPTEVPTNVSDYVAQQLNIDVNHLSDYCNDRTLHNHAQEIRQRYGYHDFIEQPYHWRLERWLYSRAWLTVERPSLLFDLATARCVEQKILLPGVTVMARLIAQIRDRSSLRLWYKLSHLPDTKQCEMLEELLKHNPKVHQTRLESLRQPVTNASPNGFLKAIERLVQLRSINACRWDISRLPINKIRVLSRYAFMARAQSIERMPYDRRIATLVSFAIIYTVSAQDDVIYFMERYFTELFNKSNRSGQKTRLSTISNLDDAAKRLSEVCALLLDENIPDEVIRKAVYSKVPKEQLISAVGIVNSLTKQPDQTVDYTELFKNFNVIRRFLPKLLTTIEFHATPAGQPAVSTWQFLADSELKTGKNKFTGAPIEGLSLAWKKVVLKESDRINPCAYTFWVIEKMLEGLKHHDIYLKESERYCDPRAKLLQGAAWEGIRPQVLRTLGWSSTAEESLKLLEERLNTAYMTTSEHWASNPSVRIETFAGTDRLVLSPLDKLDEPDSLKQLDKMVWSLVPHPDLPGLLLEIATCTKFTDEFTHISQGGSRVKDLAVSICAVLIVQACNIGLRPVVQKGVPALEYDRLTWVEQNYFRSETITQANAILVEYQSKLSLAQAWGGGEVASADGLRFVTPERTIYAGPNPRYFGIGRGVTYYNLISDQFSGLHGIVITGTIRDSIYLLECVLEQQTVLKPREIMTDTAGYSDIIFGLFALLGYQFSPRLADIGSATFWRLDDADYGVLNNLSRHKIRKNIIAKYWEDFLRIAGSLQLGTINPTSLIQMLQRSGNPTMLGRAIGEFGRIYKTLHLLTILDDEEYRRRILTQLNRGESRHKLARAVDYGKRGELHQSYREGQEDQLGTLGLVVNAIVLWNTMYMEAALNAIRKAGYLVDEKDVQRLSPLGFEHIDIVGHYSFNLPEEVLLGKLRPLLPINDERFGK